MQEILRSLRTENNYSQSAGANYLNISRQMYNKYDNGLAEPSALIERLSKLSTVLLYEVYEEIFWSLKK